MAGVLVGCACYSWERHYKFKLRGSAEHEIGVRFTVDTPPTYFGLPAVNDLLRKGQQIIAVKEGALLARKTGEDADNVHMYFSGFSVKIEFANK